jgi:hypothetical protein
MKVLVLCSGLLFLLAGCAALYPPATPPPVTVQGQISARGSEPTGVWVLETASQSKYVLVFAERPTEGFSTVATYQVTGELFYTTADGWPWPHLRVATVAALPNQE